MTSKPDSSPSLSPVAIVGMGCLFPEAGNLKEYWRLLCQGTDAIRDIPDSHWSPEDFFDENPKKPDFTYAKRGGFLSPLSFDPSEFGIPPTILEATDTAQLLSLVATKMALEDAGYGQGGKEFDKERVSVLMGVTGTLELVIPLGARLGHPLWRKALRDAGIDEEKSQEVVERISEQYVSWQESSFPGLLGNVVAGRIANRMDFGGTNCAVDAACASSLSALHLGLMELATGKADMVISGGADTLNDIFMYMCFSKTPALSPTGDARPFSSDADGTIISEGVGVLVLKRLEDAERDGDTVYAVIKSLGSSSDGRSQSIYAPRSAGQQKAIRRAYEQAGITAADIGLVEAHGTGTKVGDAVEFSALREVFEDAGARNGQTALGTVKSQIGHSKAAAGAASLIKAALSLHHKTLPPTLKIDAPNPKMGIEDSPLYLNTQTRPWLERRPRRVGVSSFGFGGSNFHAVLEEYRPQKENVAWDQSVEILPFSSDSVDGLLAQVSSWTTWLENEDPLDSQARHRRCYDARVDYAPEQPFRLLLVLTHEENWLERLKKPQSWLATKPKDASFSPQFFYNAGAREEAGDVAFVFPGQGSQYPGMGRDLARTFPEMMSSLMEAEEWAGEELALNRHLHPVPALHIDEEKAQQRALSQTHIAQPALGAVCVGMSQVLKRFGLHATASAGHSYGELVALWYAGRFSSQSLLEVSCERGRLMAGDGSDRGTMLAVSAPLAQVDAMLEETGLPVVLANRNSPTQGVLSGSREAIDEAERRCKERGLTTRRFPVSAAFHSELVQDSQAPFREFLETVPISAESLPVFSNTTAKLYPSSPEGVRDRLAQQILAPVKFVEEVEAMWEAGVRTFVEVGPKRVLSGLIPSILGERTHRVLTLDRSKGKKPGLLDLALLLSEASCHGLPVSLHEWEERPADPAPQRMSVPLVGANYRAPVKQTRPPSPPYRPASAKDEVSAAPTSKIKTPTSHTANGVPKNGVRETFARSVKTPSPAVQTFSATPSGRVSSPPNQLTTGERLMSHKAVPNGHPVSAVNVAQPSVGQPPLPSPDAGLVMQAFQVVQQGFQAMQSLQQQTTLSHQRFLESQQETSRALQHMLHSSQQLMTQALHLPSSGMVAPLPTLPVTTPQPHQQTGSNGMHGSAGVTSAWPSSPTTPAVPSFAPMAGNPAPPAAHVSSNGLQNGTANGYHHGATPQPVQMEAQKTPVRASIVPQFGQTAASNPSVSLHTRPAKPIEAAPVASAVTRFVGSSLDNAKDVLLAAVAELTGYPQEMLALDMDLEADLGIDSIKRVEILSTVTERLPEASQVDAEAMGTLRTLGQVLDSLCALTDTEASSRVASSGLETSGLNETLNPSAVLLEVVAELTGYPQEMLSMEMDLEADLGIDSIKRVEILSTVSERLPGVSEVDPETMGRLRTLEEVTNELSSLSAVQSASLDAEALATPASGDTLVETLLSVVADLTGYPEEMLELSMDMEADLGIDSIKRVEILSAVTERVPSLESLDTDELRNLRTLAEIVSAAGSSGSEQGGQSLPFDLASLREELVAGRADDIARTILNPTDLRPLCERDLHFAEGSEVLVVGDRGGFGEVLVSAFESASLSARLVSPKALETSLSPRLVGVVFLAEEKVVSELWSKDDEAALANAFLWAKAALPQLEEAALHRGGAFFVTLTRLDGMFGLSGECEHSPLQGGLAGLPKTLRRESEAISCKAIDAVREWGHDIALAEAVVGECFSTSPMEVGLQPGRRLTLKLEEAPAPSGEFVLEEGDVMVITGGARGVTASVAETLAKAFRPTLVLLGRSPLPAEEPSWLQGIHDDVALKKALFARGLDGEPLRHPRALNEAFARLQKNRELLTNLSRLREAGATVLYHSVDVRDAEALEVLFDEVQATHGPIKALIHGAGVLQDKLIADKSLEQFEAVFSTKVGGLRSVLRALRDAPLRALVLFSSVSGRVGNRGQVDYSMANEVLNKVAQHQAMLRPNCRVLSANWGPWAGGMVTPELERHFAQLGVDLIPLEAGSVALLRELRESEEQDVEVVFGGLFHEPHDVESDPAEEESTPRFEDPGKEAVLEFPVSVEYFPILHAHKIGEHAVVPMALMMEWLGEAAETVFPDMTLQGLDQVRVLRGLRLQEETVTVSLWAGEPAQSGETQRLPLEVRSSSAEGPPLLHFRGVAVLGEAAPKAPAKQRAGEEIRVEESHASAAHQGYKEVLFHGKELQGMTHILRNSPEGMECKVKTAPAPVRWTLTSARERWTGDPLAVDCAFQAAILWCHANQGMASLPSCFESYRQFSPFPSDSVLLELEVESVSKLKMRGNFRFWSPDDNTLLAHIDGYECAMNPALLARFQHSGS